MATISVRDLENTEGGLEQKPGRKPVEDHVKPVDMTTDATFAGEAVTLGRVDLQEDAMKNGATQESPEHHLANPDFSTKAGGMGDFDRSDFVDAVESGKAGEVPEAPVDVAVEVKAEEAGDYIVQFNSESAPGKENQGQHLGEIDAPFVADERQESPGKENQEPDTLATIDQTDPSEDFSHQDNAPDPEIHQETPAESVESGESAAHADYDSAMNDLETAGKLDDYKAHEDLAENQSQSPSEGETIHQAETDSTVSNEALPNAPGTAISEAPGTDTPETRLETTTEKPEIAVEQGADPVQGETVHQTEAPAMEEKPAEIAADPVQVETVSNVDPVAVEEITAKVETAEIQGDADISQKVEAPEIVAVEDISQKVETPEVGADHVQVENIHQADAVAIQAEAPASVDISQKVETGEIAADADISAKNETPEIQADPVQVETVSNVDPVTIEPEAVAPEVEAREFELPGAEAAVLASERIPPADVLISSIEAGFEAAKSELSELKTMETAAEQAIPELQQSEKVEAIEPEMAKPGETEASTEKSTLQNESGSRDFEIESNGSSEAETRLEVTTAGNAAEIGKSETAEGMDRGESQDHGEAATSLPGAAVDSAVKEELPETAQDPAITHETEITQEKSLEKDQSNAIAAESEATQSNDQALKTETAQQEGINQGQQQEATQAQGIDQSQHQERGMTSGTAAAHEDYANAMSDLSKEGKLDDFKAFETHGEKAGKSMEQGDQQKIAKGEDLGGIEKKGMDQSGQKPGQDPAAKAEQSKPRTLAEMKADREASMSNKSLADIKAERAEKMANGEKLSGGIKMSR